MSTDEAPDTTDGPPPDELTEEERELFERVRDRFEGQPVARICEIALQSSDDQEATNS